MMRNVLIALLLTVASASFAADVQFDDPAQQERYARLVHELRCLVCQNQTIADSHADLAKDLRRKVADMIHAGKTDAEIIAFLTDRYGDFVLYRPPVQSNTLLLWSGPALLLAVGLAIFACTLRRRARHVADDDEEGSA